MSGQYPGQFGPPPGGTPYGPGPAPGPAPVPGRFGTPARVLCALAPLVTFGLLGVLPPLLLAVRRRRAYDILGAAVFCALLLVMFVSAGIAGTLKNSTADITGQITLAVLWLAPTAYFLLMDRRAVWEAGPPRPHKTPLAAPPYGPPVAAPYAATVPGYGAPVPVAAPAATPVVPAAPASPAAPETGHDLRELGELLRRQVREDRR
ncbi:hypothetical protein ACFQ6N_30310 [Kitasatospora sp. NPDC056446]|uniref:hypothetical protein n=1 Tax=Kitasatospora sp. NPDC056446 TaxID=3345819 RepID=UPI0036BE22FE